MPETFLWPLEISYPVDGTFTGYETLVSQGEGGTKRYRSKRETDEMDFRLSLPRMKLPDAWQLYQFYKRQLGGATGWYLWVPDCELVENGSFETGDGTDWTLNNATVSTDEANTGLYSAKLVATGTFLSGALTDNLIVDETKKYKLYTNTLVSVLSSGSVTPAIRFGDTEDFSPGDAHELAATVLQTFSSTCAWTLTYKLIGPSGSGVDIAFPSGTKSVIIRQQGTFSGTAYMDDVSLVGYRRHLVHFKGNALPWSYFRNWRHKLTLDVEGYPA